jgi:lipoprotein-anchoring transpeptidase ErfK/SrfK
MPPRSLMSSLAFAAVAATASLVAAPQAQAQGLIDFLWGGSQEWGGSKQNVSFDPKYTAGQIIVSFGDRRIYLITRAGQAISYPIAVPREQSRWQGTTTVSDKRVNPSWRPTPEMIRENPKLPAWVPGGHRMNPLGVRAMYLGASTYRIHGTDAPWTIGQAVSKGCIRMFNDDVLDLYPRVPVGTKVTVTWQRFSSQAVASSDEPVPFNPMASGPAYKSPPRSIRQRTPSADSEVVADHKDETTAPVDPDANDQALAEAAKKPIEPKPVKKAEVHKKHEATSLSHNDAAEVATRAAAAAAEAAREAAEAAKKAAEDARKATSAQSSEPGKRAAL